MRILRKEMEVAVDAAELAVMVEEAVGEAGLTTEGEEDVVVAAASFVFRAATVVMPFSPTQSSCRRSQLRQPLGLPSHLTCRLGQWVSFFVPVIGCSRKRAATAEKRGGGRAAVCEWRGKASIPPCERGTRGSPWRPEGPRCPRPTSRT